MNNLPEDLNVAWSSIDGEGLVRVVPTDSFRAGAALVAKLAELAEAQGHDPDVLLTNSKVVVTLFSHDVQDVTERDFTYARAVDLLLDA